MRKSILLSAASLAIVALASGCAHGRGGRGGLMSSPWRVRHRS